MSKSKRTKHTTLGALLEVERVEKSARFCGAEHISKLKCAKRLSFGALLQVQMSKKCMPLWREAHFEVKTLKTPHVRATLWTLKLLFLWQAQGILHPAKREQNVKDA